MSRRGSDNPRTTFVLPLDIGLMPDAAWAAASLDPRKPGGWQRGFSIAYDNRQAEKAMSTPGPSDSERRPQHEVPCIDLFERLAQQNGGHRLISMILSGKLSNARLGEALEVAGRLLPFDAIHSLLGDFATSQNSLVRGGVVLALASHDEDEQARIMLRNIANTDPLGDLRKAASSILDE